MPLGKLKPSFELIKWYLFKILTLILDLQTFNLIGYVCHCNFIFYLLVTFCAAIKTHSPRKPVLIFVSSRRQTRLTALDLIAFLAAEDNPKQWLHMPEEDVSTFIDAFACLGIHTDKQLGHLPTKKRVVVWILLLAFEQRTSIFA